jgi:hypothetical protein
VAAGQRGDDGAGVREVLVQRADRDGGLLGDARRRERGVRVGGEQALGGVEDAGDELAAALLLRAAAGGGGRVQT